MSDADLWGDFDRTVMETPELVEPEPAPLSIAAETPPVPATAGGTGDGFKALRDQTALKAAEAQLEMVQRLREEMQCADVDPDDLMRGIRAVQLPIESREKADAAARANAQGAPVAVEISIGGPRGLRLRVQGAGVRADEVEDTQVVEDATVVGQNADELPEAAPPARRRGVVDLGALASQSKANS